MNNHEFNDFIYENLPEIPPEDIVADVNPAKQAMDRIVAGIALSTITLNFLCLNYILPAIGIIALLLGFRALKNENNWFYKGFIAVIIKAVCIFTIFIINSIIIRHEVQIEWFIRFLIGLNLIVTIILLYCLWQGIKAVQVKANLDVKAESAGALIVWYLLICICSIIKIEGMVIVGGLLIIYFFILRSLSQLPKELDEAGYLIHAVDVRFSDITIIKGIVILLAAGLLSGYVFFRSYSMDWNKKNDIVSAEVMEIKERLITLGFPEKILDDLSEEEILTYKDASQIVVDVNEYPFNDGHEVVEKYLDETWITTVYDVNELKVTDIAVELNNDKNWIFLHHFLWQEEPEYLSFSGFSGTESIQIWPVYYNQETGWRKDGEASGQLLYDKDGITYTSEYHYLGEKTYTSNDVFFGTKTSNDLFAAFSLPKEGESKRGYILYQTEELEKGWIASSWFNYTHQMHPFQYPVKTAMQTRMESSWNDAGAFKTVQDAFQIYVSEDGVEIAGE